MNMATIGRPAGIRREVESNPVAAIESAVAPESVAIKQQRTNMKSIVRMIIQAINLIFHRGSLRQRLSAPCIGVSVKCPNGVPSGTTNPTIFLTPVTDHTGNFLQIQESLDPAFGVVSGGEVQMNGEQLGFYDFPDSFMSAPGVYYLRARERNAAGTKFSNWSPTYTYTVL
jgi:hypothetical protein